MWNSLPPAGKSLSQPLCYCYTSNWRTEGSRVSESLHSGAEVTVKQKDGWLVWWFLGPWDAFHGLSSLLHRIQFICTGQEGAGRWMPKIIIQTRRNSQLFFQVNLCQPKIHRHIREKETSVQKGGNEFYTMVIYIKETLGKAEVK